MKNEDVSPLPDPPMEDLPGPSAEDWLKEKAAHVLKGVLKEKPVLTERREMPNLRSRLTALLNDNSQENVSNTPDFILASYMMKCLEAFEACVLAREDWYGHRHEPAGVVTPGQHTQEHI